MTPMLMSGLSLIFDLLKKRHLIKEQVLPLVEEAAQKAELDNSERRNFVVRILMGRGLSEADARMLTETAVRLFKKHEARRARKAARRAKKEQADGTVGEG